MKKILFIVVVVFSYVTIFGILSRLNIFNNKSDSLSSKSVLVEKTVTENGEYLAEDDNADGYSKVMVNIDKLNIAYGFTAPEDTSKLWIKTAAPEKINIVGGWEGDSYGLSSEKLSTQFSTARADMAFATVGSKVYLFGGSTSMDYLDNIVAFDMTTRTLADKTTKLPEKYVFSTAAAVGSNIYIFGGYVSATSPYTRNTIFRYDTMRTVSSSVSWI